jgi:hypothetical protein
MNNTYPDKFRKAITNSIRSRGVDVILSDFVDVLPVKDESKVTTRGGKTLEADLVVRIEYFRCLLC